MNMLQLLGCSESLGQLSMVLAAVHGIGAPWEPMMNMLQLLGCSESLGQYVPNQTHHQPHAQTRMLGYRTKRRAQLLVLFGLD